MDILLNKGLLYQSNADFVRNPERQYSVFYRPCGATFYYGAAISIVVRVGGAKP